LESPPRPDAIASPSAKQSGSRYFVRQVERFAKHRGFPPTQFHGSLGCGQKNKLARPLVVSASGRPALRTCLGGRRSRPAINDNRFGHFTRKSLILKTEQLCNSRLESVERSEFLKFLEEERACFLGKEVNLQQFQCQKRSFFFNDLELPIIVHSGSNRPYFAQFVHSGRRNERLRQRRF